MKPHKGSAVAWLLSLALAILAFSVAPVLLSGQEPPPPQPPPAPPAGPPVTVTGSVLNAATGQPLSRALVELPGTPGLGILTDGEGRFEIPDVPSGDQTFSVTKPGFRAAQNEEDEYGYLPHTVRVAAGMPELSFLLAPKSAIYGHISLSTGVPALGIGLSLLRQSIDHGRAAWQAPDDHLTTPDGDFRFSSLRDGTYLIVTQPEFENDDADKPPCSADAPDEMPGFAPEFTNGTRDLATAPRIVLEKGHNVGLNLWLQETKFHLMQAHLLHAPAAKDWTFSHALLDPAGQEVPYALSEGKDHSLCAYLPDGSYTLAVAAESNKEEQTPPRPSTRARLLPSGNTQSDDLIGVLDFSVDGAAVKTLRVPLAHAVKTTVHLSYQPAPPAPVTAGPPRRDDEDDGEREEASAPDFDLLQLSGTRANSFGQNSDSTVSATQVDVSTYELDPATPGSYRIHASASGNHLCVGVVTAAGQDLAQAPWIAGPSGAGTPIDVVLRTDCAKLTVQLPATLAANTGGEGTTWYVYAVPQFNTVDDLSQVQIRQFGEPTATFEDLTPGTYRIFAFPAPRSIEFHNPAALDRLGQGQLITLAPRDNTNLLLEGVSK